MLLSGCAALTAGSEQPGASPSASSAAIPSPSTTLPSIPDGTVVATGAFAGHGVSGTADMVVDGGTVRLDLTGLVLPDSRDYGVELLSEPPVDSACSGEHWEYDIGDVASSIPLHGDAGSLVSDPSFIAGVQLQPNWEGWKNDYPSCLPEPGGYPIVAYAPLTWTMPDLRPDLHPVDSGPRTGATGEVKLGATGIMNQYWIAPGDDFAGIAARFGIAPADLVYLNPVGRWTGDGFGGDGTNIEAGCTLNVSKQVRGATTRCTWQP